MNKDRYIKAVTKKLKCSYKKKLEIKRELIADIQSALDQGEEWQQIMERMGQPAGMASEFNENLSKEELKAYKWVKRVKVIAVSVIIIALIGAGINWIQPKTVAIKDDSSFTEIQVIDESKEIIELLNQNNYEEIQNRCANDQIKEALTEEVIVNAKEQIGADWGSFQDFTSIYTAEIKQKNQKYAVTEITALYENRSVTFTISLDEDMLLVGLYMK
jgi:hypothetical protein